MFRKISLRVLLYILVALFVLTVITQLSERWKGESTFKSELAAFDTARVTSFVISDLKDGNKSIELIKSDSGWKMKANNREYRTDDNYINFIMKEITQLKAERIAANSKEKWKEFHVTDSLALRATVKRKSKILADIMVGKFDILPSNDQFNSQIKITSYVRIAGKKEVYAVNGLIQRNFYPDIDTFRDKTIVRIEAGDLKKLTFNYPADSSFVIEKQSNSWYINGIPADSVKASQYFTSLEHIYGSFFLDDVPVNGQAVYKLTLENTSSHTVDILAYSADSLNGHIITSTLNPGAQFSGRDGLTERIFINIPHFLNNITGGE